MEISLSTDEKEQAVDITSQVQDVVGNLIDQEKRMVCNKKSRICIVYCPHTTTGLLINEGTDPDVMSDILSALAKIEPEIQYKHVEGNSSAHVKASLIGNSVIIPLENTQIKLGVWQKIFFLEFDGPRDRKVEVKIV